MNSMLAGTIAIAVLLGIALVRMLPVAFFDLSASKVEGRVRRARLRTACVVAITLGCSVAVIGVFTSIWPIRDLGGGIFLTSLPILTVRIIDARRGARRNT